MSERMMKRLEPTTLTYDGLLYQIAVFQQDLDEDPLPTAFRAEPATLQRFERMLRGPFGINVGAADLYLDGIRIEEDNALPPRPPNRVDVIDHRNRVMQIIDL